MSFQDDTGNFTMVSHVLAKEVGLVCAAVYGTVWRYCQMKEGICRASLNTLGADLSIDRATVLRSIDKLCKLGYLVDQTPDRRNAPHTYILGKSVAECNSSIDTTVVIRNSPEVKTVAYNNSSNKTVAQNNATVAECNATVAESYLNRVSKRESKRGEKPPADSLDDISWQAILAYTEIVGLKLDKIQGKAIIQLVEESPDFNLDRWRLACKTTKLAGVLERNIACRISTYKAGGDYEAMLAGRRNGTHQPLNKSSPAKSLPPDKATRYQELLATANQKE